jgi:drug/metabolite transporter (DMT)-like permease
VLAVIWGSSFILMKKALLGITAYQLGALRTVLTGLLLFSVGFKSVKSIDKRQWKWLILSGFLGSFFPAFFFAIAETEIDSSVASILNSLVPLNTVLMGFTVFGIASTKRQIVVVIVGFIGTALLILKGAELNPNQNYLYALFVILSTVMYAANVNIIKRYLQNVKPLQIAVGNYVGIFIPALVVLLWSGFFSETTYTAPSFKMALLYVGILSLFGTALSKVLFNSLIQMSTPVFASSVTYLMPLVALMWGMLDGEGFSALQWLAAFIILIGVFLSHKRKT